MVRMSDSPEDQIHTPGRKVGAGDVRLGRRITLLRKARGISQAELARRLGVTPQQYQKYERGTNRVGATRLFEIALVLGVRIQYFFEDIGEAQAAKDATDADVSAEDFLWILARLKNRDARWHALRVISTLVSEEENPPPSN